MPTRITTRGRPLVLDEILAAEFGAELARTLLTATLDLNPGLAQLGAFIPPGTDLLLPDRPTVSATRTVVSLYG
ncbi:tail protein X [Aureimonas sp. AU40]|uniref:tail protein X n=1 Tax=Aureimonas sp. AU40 TaxID=1637747 RepID=UPI00078109B8|nr:tail protein X [Aureimonas sp. AU40]